MATWSTPAEASGYTNMALTQGDLDNANAVIEIWVGVTTQLEDRLRPRDLRLLKKAEAFQAAWMKYKPALLERSDTDNVIQDTLQYTKGDQDMHVLAPLAKAAIQRLSWRAARTLEPLTPQQALAIRGKYTAETVGTRIDFSHGWSDWEDM
jgi:hypothetical protein